MKEYTFYSLRLRLPEPWYEITDTLPAGSPPTLARGANGSGALQFTIAYHTGGKPPEFNGEKLKELLLEFSGGNGLGDRRNETFSENGNLVLKADFTKGDNFIRVYYVTDRANICFATYLCQEDSADLKAELADADTIIDSIKF
jgi:hypothetical protein